MYKIVHSVYHARPETRESSRELAPRHYELFYIYSMMTRWSIMWGIYNIVAHCGGARSMGHRACMLEYCLTTMYLPTPESK